MAKLGTCARRCKGKKVRAFRACVRSCVKGGTTRRKRRKRR